MDSEREKPPTGGATNRTEYDGRVRIRVGLTWLLALALAVLLWATPLATPAQAELVGEFNARLTDVKRSYGAYTVVADARVYDTTGAPPPPLTAATVHFPRGAGLRSRFLASRFLCDPGPLEIRPDPLLCRGARFAAGRIVLDARPHILEPFSADVHMFLGRGSAGAIANVVVLVIPNELTPAYAFQVLEGRLLNRSPAGRRFGYTLELPTKVKPLIPGLRLHLAEVHLRIDGLELRRRGRRPLFWTKVPRCPASRKVSFGADYAFDGAHPISRRRRVSCRRFVRRPTVQREGEIPGAPG
jgi:hypothetical protein